MYITNSKELNNLYKCNKSMASYLIQQGCCLLSRDGNVYYFSKTQELNNALKNIPFWLKFIAKEV